ncbi:MAG: DUF4372 domain-containing protein [Pseudomonadales bacterium]|nr:DUF4372 domain-containing protein [Pseudomonadales bacterium]
MAHSDTILSQFIRLIARATFNKLAEEYHEGQAFRKFTRWDQFVFLLSAQITGRVSSRDITENFSAHKIY